MNSRFSITNLLLVILCTAICIAWWSNSTTLKRDNKQLQNQLEQLARLETALHRESTFLGKTRIDTDHFFNADPSRSTMDRVLDVQRRRTNLMLRILNIQSNIDDLLQRNNNSSAQAKCDIVESNIAECQKLKKQFEAYLVRNKELRSHPDGKEQFSPFSDEEQLSLVNDEIEYWKRILEEVSK